MATTTSSTGGLPIALGLITAGGVMVYTAFKGIGVVDVFAGDIPKAGAFIGTPDARDANKRNAPTPPANTGTGIFRGPHALELEALRVVAVQRFHLTANNVCRSAEENRAAGGSPTSLHLACRAADYTGKPTDMMAFARFAHALPWIDEVFYDPAGYTAPGYDHSDHVHVGA